MASCSKHIFLNKHNYVLYSILFKVTTFCFDDSLAHSLHSLSQLHEVVTWNGFPIGVGDTANFGIDLIPSNYRASIA